MIITNNKTLKTHPTVHLRISNIYRILRIELLEFPLQYIVTET